MPVLEMKMVFTNAKKIKRFFVYPITLKQKWKELRAFKDACVQYVATHYQMKPLIL